MRSTKSWAGLLALSVMLLCCFAFIALPGAGAREFPLETVPQIDQVLLVKNRAAADYTGCNVAACMETMANLQGIDLKGLTSYVAMKSGASWAEKNQKDVKGFCTHTGKPLPRVVDIDKLEDALTVARVLKVPVMIGDMAGKDSPYKARAAAASVIVTVTKESVCLVDPNWVDTASRYQWVRLKDLPKRYGDWSAVLLPRSPQS